VLRLGEPHPMWETLLICPARDARSQVPCGASLVQETLIGGSLGGEVPQVVLFRKTRCAGTGALLCRAMCCMT